MIPVETLCRALVGYRMAAVVQVAGDEGTVTILSAYRDVALMAERLFPPTALTVAFERALRASAFERENSVNVACAELDALAGRAEEADLSGYYDSIARELRAYFNL